MSKPTPIVEGPRGYRMPESLARRIEDAAKSAGVKADDYRRRAAMPSDFRLEDGSRSDVSTVTTDAIDHDREMVMPAGIDLSVFRANPVVPFAHKYDELPVGKCAWIKSAGNGLIACTRYAQRPQGWEGGWLPDAIMSMMQDDMCKGKSIGFIPTSMRDPTRDEISARPELANCRGVIDRSTLLEYSVAPVPANPEALSMAVSKCFGDDRLKSIIEATAAKDLSYDEPNMEAMPACPRCKSPAAVKPKGDAYTCTACSADFVPTSDADGDHDGSKGIDVPDIIVPFVSPQTIARARALRIDNLKALALPLIKQAIQDEYDRLCGRV